MNNHSQVVSLPKIDEPHYRIELLDRLKEVVAQKYALMLSDKKETPTLVIPKNLISFTETKLFYNLLAAIHDYLSRYNALLQKYNELQKKLSMRVTMQHEMLQSERHELTQFQKEITIYYGVVLLKYSSKNSKRDQFFFETLIYLTGKVMRSFFTREEFFAVEEQIDRLFRSQKYNIIKKRHDNDQILREFPILKDQQKANKVNISTVLSQAEEKSSAIRELVKVKKQQKQTRKTISVSGPEIYDKDKRSPILSVYLPSNRVRMVTFTREKSVRVYPNPDMRRSKFNIDESITRLENPM